MPLVDEEDIDVQGGSWLFGGKSPPSTPTSTGSASTPTGSDVKRSLWGVLTGSPSSQSSSSSKTVLDDYVEGDNVNGTVLRLYNDNKSSLVQWATIEQGMIKYFREKPADSTVRPLGYVTLTGAKIKVSEGRGGEGRGEEVLWHLLALNNLLAMN